MLTVRLFQFNALEGLKKRERLDNDIEIFKVTEKKCEKETRSSNMSAISFLGK